MRMKTHLLLTLFLLLGLGMPATHAQLQNGATAPDFTLTDLDGNTWNLYTLLNQGKTVYLEFSATWCGPCWNYHSGNHLKNLYDQYGPNGTDEVFVMFIEGDLNTNTACLYGPAGCVGGTQGNWVAGTPFPIVDLNSTNIGVRYDYQIAYWPTIYAICPQTKKVYLAGQRSTSGQYEYVSSCGMTYDLDGVGDVSCHGQNDGYVHLSPNGGYAPYTYTWSNGFSGQNLNNVGAGTYSCTIRDKNQIQIGTSSYTVTQPDDIFLVNDGVTTETCPGYEDGGVSISVSGGAGGFSYSWSNGVFEEDLVDVAGGTYTVVVSDATGCTKQQSFVVPVNPLPVADAGVDGVITCSAPQFTIDGTGSEPSGVSYLWTTANGNIVSGANSPTPVVDKAGDYTLTVTFFATGCLSTDEAAVAEDLANPLVDAGPEGMVDCQQVQDTLDGSNSQGGQGFTYLWTTDDGNIVSGASTPHPVVNAPGSYILTVTNQGTGCFSRDTTLVVTGPHNGIPESDYAHAVTNLIVTFTQQVSGNPTSYLWTFGDGNSSTAQNPTHVYQTEGTYTVCLTTGNACGDDTHCAEVTVTAGSMSVAVVGITPATCNNNSEDGAIDIEVAGGTPDYTYTWSNGATTQDLAEIPAGSYSVTVTDSDGEVTILNVTLLSLFVVEIEEALSQHPACFGEASGVIALNTNSSGGSLDYLWSHDPDLNASLAKDLPAGLYSVLITDQQGCTDAIEVLLIQPDAILGNLEVTPSEQGQDNGTAQLNPAGGTAPYAATWSNGASGLTVNGLAPGEYEVILTDANGCTWTETFRVDEAVSIGSIPSLQQWTLQPNPARGQVWLGVEFSKVEQSRIRLLNMLGGEVFQRDITAATISEQIALGHLPAGTYFLEVRTAEGRLVQKLVIH